MVFTGALTAVAVLQLIAMIWQGMYMRAGLRVANANARAAIKSASAAKRSVAEMQEGAAAQSASMQASVAEATRASTAMERVAESMERNAASIEKSISISKRLARVNESAMLVSQRARVYFDRVQPAPIGANIRQAVQILLKNSGGKTAYLLAHGVGSIVTDYEPWETPKPVIDADGWYTYYRAPLNTAQGIELFHEITPPLTDAQWKEIEAGKVRLLIYAAVVYDDGFGNVRKTGYGWEYSPRATHSYARQQFTPVIAPGYNYED